MSAHYSQPLDWNDELLENQKAIIEKWYKLYEKSEEESILDISDSLLDDLNTPGFIAKIHELYNSAIKGDKKKKSQFNNACRLLGLFNINKNEWEDFKKLNKKISEESILKMINERHQAKEKNNFNLADKIRKKLSDEGVAIEDLKGKTIWKFK